jgi:hypothetical protein
MLILSVCFAVPATALLIDSMFAGYDVTDEGFYLYAADGSNKTNAANGLWGMYIGLVYQASGYSLVGFRLAGWLLLAACAGWLGHQTGGLVGALTGWPLCRVGRVAVVVSTVTAAQLYYALMILTPSYNWLAVCGLMLTLAGVFGVLAGSARAAARFGNAALVSLGCFLTFWARSVAGVAVWVLAQILIFIFADASRRDRLKLVAVSASGLVVLAAIHSIAMLDPASTVEAMQRAKEFNFTHGFSKSPRNMVFDGLDQLRAAPRNIYDTVRWWPLLGAVPALARFAAVARRVPLAAIVACTAVLAVGAVLVVNRRFDGGPQSYLYLTPAVMGLLLTAAIAWAACAVVRRSCPDRDAGLPRRALVVFGVLTIAVLATQTLYAFTSNNVLFGQMSGASVLGLLGAQLLLTAAVGRQRILLALLTFALLVPSALSACVVSGRKHPYRDAPLAQATVPVTINRHGAQILLAAEYAAYYHELVGSAQAAGFVPGTPLIDLTPFSPGLPEALGALAPNTLLMGYTADTARWAVSQQDQTIWRDAWLLVRRTDDAGADVNSVTCVLGRNFPTDYEMISTATYPYNGNEHQFWRPRFPEERTEKKIKRRAAPPPRICPLTGR